MGTLDMSLFEIKIVDERGRLSNEMGVVEIWYCGKKVWGQAYTYAQARCEALEVAIVILGDLKTGKATLPQQ